MPVQKINILIVNQSVIDLCASIFMLTTIVEVDGTRMSPDSIYDQFVCRIWLTRAPLWVFLNTSTYAILLIALERYIAVIYPFWYNVRITLSYRQLTSCLINAQPLPAHSLPQTTTP